MNLQPQSREDFTSEVFKIEITNINYFGFGELKTFLKKKLMLNPVKIKASPIKRDLAYLCFRNEEERTNALAKLDGYKWKGKAIKAVPSKAVIDPMEKKRQQSTNDRVVRVVRTVQEATAPLAKMPYEEQLKQKESELLEILRAYGNQAQRGNRELKFKEKMSANNGIPCEWLGFKASPLINGYRNKSEFTVGKNSAGEKVVGFRLSSYVDGSVEVDSCMDELPHIPDGMKQAAAVYQQYIRESPHLVFNPETYTGVFRQLTVRISQSSSEIMLVIGVHTKPIEDTLQLLKEDIIAYFTEREGKSLGAASIYLEHMNKRESGQTSNLIEHLLGVTHITDVIHGLKFRISPESFFQINTIAAEVLYQSAIDLGSPTDRTTVMDICCGTGSIGLCFAKYCKQVVGVEIIPQAIQDAEFNATANGITNCKFYAGNCDDYIRKFVYENNKDGDLLAIIDPPRAGLHVKSIASLRNSKGLDRFVYISCSPKAALRNWLDLARPSSKQYKYNPFVVTAAVGVDMFPHTPHKEMVLLFERVPEPEAPAAPIEISVAPVPVVETSDVSRVEEDENNSSVSAVETSAMDE